MKLWQARHIAKTVNRLAGDDRFFQAEKRQAFALLHKSATDPRKAKDIRKDDQKLAQTLWDHAS